MTHDAQPSSKEPALNYAPLQATGGVRLDQARLNDQQRLSVVLQGAAALAQLEHGGWVLPDGWDDISVDRHGLLSIESIRPGRSDQLVQVALDNLLHRLFHTDGKIAGRGAARTAARYLTDRWQQVLVPITADQAIHEILLAAPFLWGDTFAKARGALVAEHSANGHSRLWLAGPGAARRRFLSRTSKLHEVQAKLASNAARDVWDGWLPGSDPRELMSRGLRRQAAIAWSREPPRGRKDRLAHARCLFALGRYAQTLEALKRLSHLDARLLRAWSQHFMGQHYAAEATTRRLSKAKLSPEQTVEFAELAIRVFAARGKQGELEEWIARSLSTTRGKLRLRASIVAAGAAWDRRDPQAMDHLLETSREALEHSDLAGRWHHMRGLYWSLIKDNLQAVQHIATALRLDRRQISQVAAGRLWNDLTFSRGQADDLPGAERAATHAVRLLHVCDGPSQTTLALFNLAEIRLRRGRGQGIESILERSTSQNQRGGNIRGLIGDLELWVRLELAQGRSVAALTRCNEALAQIDRNGLKDQRRAIEIFAARAYGWLGQHQKAADYLDRYEQDSLLELEPEERPAIWAHAGHFDKACEIASGTRWAPLWKAITAGVHPTPDIWSELESLEDFRAARLIFDCELLLPGVTPPHRVREAIATLRRCHAGVMAEKLESRSLSPWQALWRYLDKSSQTDTKAASFDDSEQADIFRKQPSTTFETENTNPLKPELAEQDVAKLFAEMGYNNIQLSWIQEDREQILVAGAGGEETLSCRVPAGGHLRLRAPVIDDVLKALLALVRRDLKLSSDIPRLTPPSVDGIVGESRVLRNAIERLDLLAKDDLPILILGESGTGKELMAKRAHRISHRSSGPFIPINCAAVQESLVQSELFGHVRGSFTGADRDRPGIFESARSGTVFLDEIGDLPPVVQGKLLRVLQEGEVRRIGESHARKVDVRVITATHRDLDRMIERNEFRGDLYFRLKVATVTLPPLRDRGKDILQLVDYFLTRRRSENLLSEKARAKLLSHPWPGNIRELQNILSVADTLAQNHKILPEDLDLPQPAEAKGDYHQMIEQYRRDLISKAMTETGGNRAAAARRLGLTRQALSYLVRQLGLN